MNQNISNQLDSLMEKFITYKHLDATWNLEEKNGRYSFHTKANPLSEVNINRIEVLVKDVEYLKLEQYFSKVTTRTVIDSTFETKEIFNDGNQIITYGKGQPPFPGVDARDFIIATKIYRIAQGDTLIVNKSIFHEAYPPVPGTQRAEMHFNFTQLKQISANEELLLSIGLVDPKGDIPKMLVNKGGAKQVDSILKIIEYARTH